MRTPVAYLRKSHVSSDRHTSWETQEAAVRKMAAAHGDTDLTILFDWSKSGRLGREGRPGYNELLTLIEADKVSAVYSYSLSRLSRSLPDFRRLVDLCVAHDTAIRLEADTLPDITKASGTLVVSIIGAVAEFEAAITHERIMDSQAVRIARGDTLGSKPYGSKPGEDVARVIEAYRTAGSCYGAARVLNDAGFPSRYGSVWASKTVGGVLARAGVPYARHGHRGVKSQADWRTYRLLTCPCGNTMTTQDRRSPRVTCYKARATSGHPAPYGISEAKLLPALMAEAARLSIPASVQMPVSDADQRQALSAKRDRVIDLFAEGLIDKAERSARLLAISGQLEALDAAQEVISLPPDIDWDASPKAVNAVLRALWERVELGPDLMPINFVWRVPEWRDSTAA